MGFASPNDLKNQRRKEKNTKTNRVYLKAENKLMLKGAEAIVKPIHNPEGMEFDSLTISNTVFNNDIEGKNVSIPLGNSGKSMNFCQFISPEEKGLVDYARLWRNERFAKFRDIEDSEERKKAIKEDLGIQNLRTKNDNYILVEVLKCASDPESVGTLKALPMNNKMNDFVWDAVLTPPITDTVEAEKGVSLLFENGSKKVDIYNVVDCSSTAIAVDVPIKVDTTGAILEIANKEYTFESVEGNKFMGVRPVDVRPFDIDSEYALKLSPVKATAFNKEYNEYALGSKFIKFKEMLQADGSEYSNYSEMRTEEELAQMYDFDIKDAMASIATEEESYYKLHKFFLGEDISFDDAKKKVAELKSKATTPPSNKKEEVEEEVEAPVEVKAPKPAPKKLVIESEELSEEYFEPKVEAKVEEKKEEKVEKKTLKADATNFSMDDINLDDLDLDAL